MCICLCFASDKWFWYTWQSIFDIYIWYIWYQTLPPFHATRIPLPVRAWLHFVSFACSFCLEYWLLQLAIDILCKLIPSGRRQFTKVSMKNLNDSFSEERKMFCQCTLIFLFFFLLKLSFTFYASIMSHYHHHDTDIPWHSAPGAQLWATWNLPIMDHCRLKACEIFLRVIFVLVRADLTRVTSPTNSTPRRISSYLLLYFLFIFHIPRWPLPDFPSVSSLVSLSFPTCCHLTTTTTS